MSSDYCTRSDIEAIYGANNIAEWADLDNDESAATITSRIAGAISDASDYLDDRFRDSQYAVPLGGGAAPRQIVRLCALLAGVYLYEARGALDVNAETGQAVHRFVWQRKEVDRRIDYYLDGRMKLDAARTPDTSAPPTPLDIN